MVNSDRNRSDPAGSALSYGFLHRCSLLYFPGPIPNCPEVPITCPAASNAWTLKLAPLGGTGMAVSNPDLALLATTAGPLGPDSARTLNEWTWVSPFQLA